MVAKCANPVCTAPFLYLREGKLYQIEMGADDAPAAPAEQSTEERKPGRRLEFFWLCGSCAAQMTLVFDPARGVISVPVHHSQRAVAS
jgi:hypothetical protein